VNIAIAQLEMRDTCAGNVAGVLDHLARAKALGADVVVLPECATTGYHRTVPEQISPAGIEDAIGRIRERCASLQVAAVFGTPYYPADDAAVVWNATVAVDASGEVVAVAPKVGLTATERRFFTAGADRPVFSLGSTACASVLCREIRDAEQILPGFGPARVTFWPGIIDWPDPGAPAREDADPDNMVTPEIARTFARTLDSYVVQCNWPNSVNRPGLTRMGGSLVLSPAGEVVHRCPLGEAGITCVALELDEPGTRTIRSPAPSGSGSSRRRSSSPAARSSASSCSAPATSGERTGRSVPSPRGSRRCSRRGCTPSADATPAFRTPSLTGKR
jgi:omega-amidase